MTDPPQRPTKRRAFSEGFAAGAKARERPMPAPCRVLIARASGPQCAEALQQMRQRLEHQYAPCKPPAPG
jgi:hypothetical protein